MHFLKVETIRFIVNQHPRVDHQGDKLRLLHRRLYARGMVTISFQLLRPRNLQARSVEEKVQERMTYRYQ